MSRFPRETGKPKLTEKISLPMSKDMMERVIQLAESEERTVADTIRRLIGQGLPTKEEVET